MSMTKEERIAQHRAKLLWCVHILGPDEMIPKESYEAAEKHATELTEFMYGTVMATMTLDPVMCLPIVALWPYSAEAHAKELANDLAEERKRETPLASERQGSGT